MTDPRPAERSATLTSLLVMVLGSAAGAQEKQEAKPPPQRPSYKFLRWQEDWSDLLELAPGDVDFADAIKHMKLNDSGSIWASFGGDLRVRPEDWNGFNFGSPPGQPHDDTYTLFRVRAHGDFHFGENYRTILEFKSALSTDRDLPGGKRPIDEDTFAVQQFFFDATVPLGERDSITVRPGRQQYALGAQRLVSPLPWANVMRTWDGLGLYLKKSAWNVTALASDYVIPDQYGWDEANGSQQLYGIYGTRAQAKGAKGIDLYVLGNVWKNTTFNGTTGTDERATFGVRAWNGAAGRADWEIEADYQTGSTGPGDVSAWSWASQFGYSLGKQRSTRLWLGFDWASGDRSPGGSVQTFNQIYPLGHAYFGIIDAIGRQNIIDTSLGVSWRHQKNFSLVFGNHSFWVDSTQDAIYNAGGGVVRPGGSFTSPWIGIENDFVATWRFERHHNVQAGAGYFWAGDAIEQSGPSENTTFLYAQYTFTF